MKKQTVQILLYVSAAFGVAVAFNQCGGVKFAEGGQRSDGYSLSARGNNLYQVTQPLTGKGIKPLDIVWIIDNSASMDDEAANVRNNFERFAKNLELADVKLALISQKGTTGTYVSLPKTSFPSLQVDRNVFSINPLHILASTLCPVTPAANSGCAAIAPTIKNYTDVRGALTKFLRPDSRKIFVFVTDDNNAASITSAKFKALYDSLYAADSLVVYGWVGLGQALTPNQADTGKVYLELASMTGGSMYNVGDRDWSDKFTELQNNVTTLAFDTIPLPQDVIHSEIIAVFMNGRELSLNDYKITANGIVLAESVRAGVATAQVQVEFKTPKAQ